MNKHTVKVYKHKTTSAFSGEWFVIGDDPEKPGNVIIMGRSGLSSAGVFRSINREVLRDYDDYTIIVDKST